MGQARGRGRTSARRRRHGTADQRSPTVRTKRRSIRHLLSAFSTEHRSTFRGLAFVTAKSKTLSRHRCCATLGESTKPHACPAPGPPCGKPAHANMGHMAHLSRLPGSTSWGIQDSIRVRARLHERPIKTTGAQPGEGRRRRPSPLLRPDILPLNGANPALRMGHMAHPSEPSTRTVKAGNP